jgi:hypothetical protein
LSRVNQAVYVGHQSAEERVAEQKLAKQQGRLPRQPADVANPKVRAATLFTR